MPARTYYLELAQRGLVMPIGTDLLLQESDDPHAILTDGEALGRVVVASAQRWHTPLAVPLMDLQVEKEAMLLAMGVASEAIETYHFQSPPDDAAVAEVPRAIADAPTPRIGATCDAIRHVARADDQLLPIGMCIGPFSFMTKLVADPITPVFLAGTGVTAAEDEEVALMEATLALGTQVILSYVRMQLDAGARAVIVCEPAANIHYLSPSQLNAGADIFERYVMEPNRRLRALLASRDADLIFHDCGELTDAMVQQFGDLDPAIISLGSSRVLWEDAPRLPKTTVIYGNLPSKQFYSDQVISCEAVVGRARQLLDEMAQTGHPFILGTECDVLSVTGCEQVIRGKVDAMMRCGCPGSCCS